VDHFRTHRVICVDVHFGTNTNACRAWVKASVAGKNFERHHVATTVGFNDQGVCILINDFSAVVFVVTKAQHRSAVITVCRSDVRIVPGTTRLSLVRHTVSVIVCACSSEKTGYQRSSYCRINQFFHLSLLLNRLNRFPDSFQGGGFSYERGIPSRKRGALYFAQKLLPMDQRPRIRPLEPVQLPTEAGEDIPRFLLKDSAGLAEEQVIVTLPGLYLVELADGSRTTAEIAASMLKLTGVSVEESQVRALLESLDQRYLVENRRARTRLAELSPRPMRHAGSGYPIETSELTPFLDGILGLQQKKAANPFRRASILPHIDFYRGKEAYRAGYQHLHGLAETDYPLTVVILGISHAFCQTPFILTKKDFETPLGVVKTDVALVEQLTQGLPFDPFEDEYNHIGEHSVEFHAVLLRRLNSNLRIVPILCRSFHEAVKGRFDPRGLPGVTDFLKNLANLRDERPDIHFLASVDLAHMGVNFGGPPLSEEFLDRLRLRDLDSLAGVSNGRADEFFATHQADQGDRNYCGTPAIYTLLSLFPEPFELHRYQQCTDPDLSSTVTICSATLH
jgi:MEMO1 family protein